MLKTSLCSYSDTCILIKENVTAVGAGADNAARATDGNDTQPIFKNYPPFTDSITGINNTQVDNAKDLDVVMPIHISIEYSNNYSKTSGSL